VEGSEADLVQNM